jgi:hypothetical protein
MDDEVRCVDWHIRATGSPSVFVYMHHIGDSQEAEVYTAWIDYERQLSSQACLNSENGLISGESWNLEAVRHYLVQAHDLLKQLDLIMYLSGGQSCRH